LSAKENRHAFFLGNENKKMHFPIENQDPKMMPFPEVEDFMACFGMVPLEKDMEMLCFRYVKKSDDGFGKLIFLSAPWIIHFL